MCLISVLSCWRLCDCALEVEVCEASASKMRRSNSRRSSGGVRDLDAQDASGPMDATPPHRAPIQVGRSLEPTMPADVCMESILDKLQLLNYQKEFCRKRKPYREPLHRQFFAMPPGHETTGQFTYFASLVTWLLQLVGRNVSMPREFDDPNTVCTNLLTELRGVGFAAPNFALTKLYRGYGTEVCGILDNLVDYVLEFRGFTFKPPVYPPDQEEEEDVEDDDTELTAVDMLDEVTGVEDDEEEAYMAGVRDESQETLRTQELEDKQMLTSRIDADLWRLEVERVSSKLRIKVGADARDWRHHLEQAHQHYESISAAWPEGTQQLEKVQRDVGASLEKLETREKYLNECCGHLTDDYKSHRTHLQKLQDEYNTTSEAVSKKNNELHRIQEQLEEIRQIMEERGSSISDASPVVHIKSAIKKLTEEIRDMEVMMGIVSHSLMQVSLKDKGRSLASVSEGSEYYGL